MRTVHDFNQDWLFAPQEMEPHSPDDLFEAITLPHSNKIFESRYVDNAAYQFVSTYRKRFSLAEELAQKRVFLQFEGAMLETSVCLNDKHLGVHQGGYSPFRFEISDVLIDGENLLMVSVDAREHKHIPPYGNLVDFLTFGGIYREVSLLIVERCHISEIIATPVHVLTQPQLQCAVRLSEIREGLQVRASLRASSGETVAQAVQKVDAELNHLTLDELPGIEVWSLQNPVLYTLEIEVCDASGVIDRDARRIGFREAEFRQDGRFYLNGEAIKLFGLNRHQTYPFIGAAAPKRLQELDADILKHELGCNIVRTSHYAQSAQFLNRCDEIGLLVFEEIAGWQFVGDEAWQALVLDDLRAMIERDRHHPSIILWGVRVNESPDHEAFYTQTNALAHQLDPSRQTGGVRDFLSSQQLEDVFTLNDFTEIIQTPRPPHLITEFVGHTFPAKTTDHEERRVEHALRHARKHNLQFGHEDVAGAIGWCAFDYHTHKEFGSGDRVCHHGVMDMFRLPKYAAYFYRSQKSPEDEIILFAATSWTMGDRDGGGNNPLLVFSNCDEIEVFIGEELQGRFRPDYTRYPHLPHPPFTVRWPEPYNPWGTAFQDLTILGFIAGNLVKTQIIASDHVPDALRIFSHTEELTADGRDMARIAVQIVDKFGNVLPYQMPVITWSIEGSAQLIGENPMALIGGQGACFVRAGYQPGEIVVTASSSILSPARIQLIMKA